MYCTIIEAAGVYARANDLINQLCNNVKHTAEKDMTIAFAKGMAVIGSNTPINEAYQDKVIKGMNALFGENTYIIKFNQPKPDIKFDYIKFC